MAEAVQECATHQPTGGSGVPNLQQVTTIPYCINYNCTIENYGIGQLLDIVYTTDSFLVVIRKGNQTSMVITKHGDDLSFYCVSALNSVLLPLIVSSVILLTAQLLMISYIIIVHMLIKELRTSFGVLSTHVLQWWYSVPMCYCLSFDTFNLRGSHQFPADMLLHIVCCYAGNNDH